MRFKAFALLLLLPAIANAATTTIPAAASVHGRLGTFFHSDVAVLNTSRTATASVTARYRCFGGNCGPAAVQTFTIAPRQVRFFSDIVTTLFNAPETGGAIELESDTPLVATSRLYTPSRPEPTVGQFVPGLPQRESFTSSTLLSLSHSVDGTRGFRTNIGIFNPSTADVDVYITLYSIDGATLNQIERTVPARQPLQINDIFGVMGVNTDVPAAYCEISGGLGSTALFTYASVVDNQSQDPIFVTGQPGYSSDRIGVSILPAVASLHGRGGTFFHSDVAIYKPGAAFKASYRCFGGACGNSVQQFVIPPLRGVTYNDIVNSLFSAPETGGAVEFETIFRPAITSRLYTPTKPQPTVGQFVPAMDPSQWHFASVVTFLSHSPDGSTGFRSNVGAYNPHDVPQTVSFEVFDETGVELGRFTRNLGAHDGVQINNVFGEVGVSREIRSGYCTVRGDGVHGLLAYGSVIDNLSQDPIFIPGRADDGCEYVLDEHLPSFTESGGNDDIAVVAPPGCAWTVTNDTPWLTVTSGSAGSGNGTVRLTATRNPSSENRSGTLLIAGQRLTASQSLGTLSGQWKGSSGLGSLSFGVSFNQTGTWTIAFTAPGSGCTIFGTVTRSGTSRITNGKMDELRMSGSVTGGTYSFTINGTFPTLSTANGTLAYNLTSGSCSSSGTTTWFASKQ